MKYLLKNENSSIIRENLSYEKKSERPKIKQELIKEQENFCAYSERYLLNTDEIHIEHFDGRIKHTTDDNYYNWYAVLSWMNSHKAKKIEPFLPIIQPYEIDDKISYTNGVYFPTNSTDIESKNLIEYLGLNKYELFVDREKHISEMKTMLTDFCNNDIEKLKDFLKYNRKNLSFYTALEHELNIDLSDLIF